MFSPKHTGKTRCVYITESQWREYLLEAADLDFINQKYYPQVPRDTFRQIVEADPTYNPNNPQKMGKYGKWLLAIHSKGALRTEDLYKATEYLAAFNRFINRMPVKDVNQFRDLIDLYDNVKPFLENPDQATSKSDEVRQAKQGAEKVYEDGEWLVVVPHTREASCYYGKGTQWCTAADNSENMFERYNEEGPLYININKRTGRKYQFHFETEQYRGERDEPIPIAYVGLSDGLKLFYGKRVGWDVLISDEPDFVIPVTTTEIDDWAFFNCTSLRNVTIPDSVIRIGESAFEDCDNLTSVTIPNSVREICKKAFSGCTGMRDVTIPDSVREIGESAFASCYNLRSVTIPHSITEISVCMFECCTDLTDVTISDSVTVIGDGAFFDCTSLRNVTIPDSVREIGWEVFYGCTSLTDVTIPDSVTVIGDGAFPIETMLHVTSQKMYDQLARMGYNRISLKQAMGTTTDNNDNNNDIKTENYMRNKQTIRLTESDLHRVIKESVKYYLKEEYEP